MTKCCFIGLDVGRYEIFACVLSENREEITSFSFSQIHVGYNLLIDQVMDLQSQGLFPIVSSEGHSVNLSPLDEYLITSQISFKPLNPNAVSRYKEVLGQPQKTDAYDAFVMADLLWLQHHRKDAMMQIAVCNSRNCPQSKIYYQKQRKAGKSHWQAIKCLARQLVRVLFAMSRDQTDYQPKALSMRVATT